MVAFSRLPDACLLTLFKQLPPEEQLRFRSVCRKWDTLIPVAASTRHSIIIIDESYSRDFVGFEKLQPPITIHQPAMHLLKKEDGSLLFPQDHPTAWDCLNIACPLPECNCHLIASTFTGVSTLKVILAKENPEHFKMVAILIQLWRHQLTSLQLIENYYGQKVHRLGMFIPAGIADLLYAAINSLSGLKRLVLNLNDLPLCDLPVIAHLEGLDISHHGTGDLHHCKLVENLVKYGQSNRNLIQVSYSFDPDSVKKRILEHFTSLSDHLRQAFTCLNVLISCNKDLTIVCNHFKSLTTLDVSYTIDAYGLVSLFQELPKLKQLINLSLYISIFKLPSPIGHRPLQQLFSVKALALWLRLRTPQHMAALNIGWYFPNLQVIEFQLCEEENFLGCGFDIDENQFPIANLELAKECLRQVFLPLKRRFGSQLTILHNLTGPYYGIGSAEELLATI